MNHLNCGLSTPTARTDRLKRALTPSTAATTSSSAAVPIAVSSAPSAPARPKGFATSRNRKSGPCRKPSAVVARAAATISSTTANQPRLGDPAIRKANEEIARDRSHPHARPRERPRRDLSQWEPGLPEQPVDRVTHGEVLPARDPPKSGEHPTHRVVRSAPRDDRANGGGRKRHEQVAEPVFNAETDGDACRRGRDDEGHPGQDRDEGNEPGTPRAKRSPAHEMRSRSERLVCAGAIVCWTEPIRSARNSSRSTSSRRTSAKASTVRVALERERSNR